VTAPITARSLPGWTAITAAALAMAAPVAVIAWSIVSPDTDMWRSLWHTRLPSMITSTVALLVAVLAGTLVLGTSLAWLVTNRSFPGRRLIGWLLVTPLAMPGYVLGFVWLDTLSGPLGQRNVRSLWVCAVVMTLTLYPYVYLFARAALRSQAADPVAAARSLGCTRTQAFWRVTLPMARPALAAGAALVAMEVLTDIGTVRLFNVSTIADGVMRVWFGTGNRDGAAEVSLLLIAAAAGLITLERFGRGRGRYAQQHARQHPGVETLGRVGTLASIGMAVAVVALAVVVPVARLVGWALEAHDSGQAVTQAGGLMHHTLSTVRIASIATAVCLVMGIVLALAVSQRGAAGRVLGRVATLGYAVPGPVVAVGVVIVLAAIDRSGWLPGGALLVGSVAGLVYALTVRFVAVAFQGTDSSLARVPEHAVASARTLGAGRWRVATRVLLPHARAGLIAAAALVAADSVKELPVTLLLRPFGVDTLSVWVWQATSESLWAQAAVPALAIVVVGMIPVAILLYALERGAEVVS
jgi:iron(III) transport system permease protein